MMFKPPSVRHALDFLLILFLFWSIAAFPVSRNAWAESLKITEIIQLDTGKITGQFVGKDPEVRVFKGIPFAAPPMGTLRMWPPGPWNL